MPEESLAEKLFEPPETELPAWGEAELPKPKPLSWKNWTGFIGPGLVMCRTQLAGGKSLGTPPHLAQPSCPANTCQRDCLVHRQTSLIPDRLGQRL